MIRSALERPHIFRSVLERRHSRSALERQYIIAYIVNGSAVKWLVWDKRKVWRWSKTKHLAARFATQDRAIAAAENTSMVWQYKYQVDLYK